MALFTKSRKSKIDRSTTTIIAAGTQLEGSVRLACKFHVDGEFAGSVHSDNLITIGKAGLIEGEIVAKKLVITGRFKGHAHCDEIDILAGGHVIGQLSARALVIERGSVFEGDSRLKEPQESAAHARETGTLTTGAAPAQTPPSSSEETLDMDVQADAFQVSLGEADTPVAPKELAVATTTAAQTESRRHRKQR